MATQKTIAIIGALEEAAAEAVCALTGKDYRLLLFYKQTGNGKVFPSSVDSRDDVEWVACPKEACWEADLIVLAVHANELPAVAADAAAVATGKPVIDILNRMQDPAMLQTLFPHSAVRYGHGQDIAMLVKDLLQ